MGKKQDKPQAVKGMIESTLVNAIDTQNTLAQTDDFKEQQQLLDKNAGRAQAMSSLIRDFKESEAEQQLESERR